MAASSYSIVQGKLPPDLSGRVALAAIFEASFGEVAVLEVFDVFLDELGGVEGLGAAGLPCEAREAPFERGFQANGKHPCSPGRAVGMTCRIHNPSPTCKRQRRLVLYEKGGRHTGCTIVRNGYK